MEYSAIEMAAFVCVNGLCGGKGAWCRIEYRIDNKY